MIGHIYKITSPTGRIYIGQTKNLKTRLRSYRNLNCLKQLRLLSSLKKYGWEQHIFEIIEDVNFGDLDNREIYWIDFYKSNVIRFPDEKGMNLTDGGVGNKGPITEEHRKKLSDRQREKLTPEHKAKISAKMKGTKRGPSKLKGVKRTQEVIDKIKKTKEENPYTHNEETRLKISNSGKGRIPYNVIKVEAYRYDTGEYVGTYNSYVECSKILNIPNKIYDVLIGKRKQTGGYTFKKVM